MANLHFVAILSISFRGPCIRVYTFECNFINILPHLAHWNCQTSKEKPCSLEFGWFEHIYGFYIEQILQSSYHIVNSKLICRWDFEIEYLNIDIQHAYKHIGFRYSDVQNYLIQKANCYNFQKKNIVHKWSKPPLEVN